MSLSDSVLTFVNSAGFKRWLPWVAGGVFVVALLVAGFASCGGGSGSLPAVAPEAPAASGVPLDASTTEDASSNL
jgi:hypothetical protein